MCSATARPLSSIQQPLSRGSSRPSSSASSSRRPLARRTASGTSGSRRAPEAASYRSTPYCPSTTKCSKPGCWSTAVIRRTAATSRPVTMAIAANLPSMRDIASRDSCAIVEAAGSSTMGAKVPSKSNASTTVAGAVATASRIPLPASVKAVHDLSAGTGRSVMRQSSHIPDSWWVRAAK